MDDSFEAKAIQTAYLWTRSDNYGSEDNAVMALLNRKDISCESVDEAKKMIQLGLLILDKTDELAEKEMQNLGKKNWIHFSQEEIDLLVIRMAKDLEEQFPGRASMINYALGIIVLHPWMR